MLTSYPACFYKEKEGGYSVIFPDLNHLATCGDTLEEALSMAIDCLAGFVYQSGKQNEMIPEATTLSGINVDEEYDKYEEVFVNIVSVDVAEYARPILKGQ